MNFKDTSNTSYNTNDITGSVEVLEERSDRPHGFWAIFWIFVFWPFLFFWLCLCSRKKYLIEFRAKTGALRAVEVSSDTLESLMGDKEVVFP